MKQHMTLIIIGVLGMLVIVGVAAYAMYCDTACKAERLRGEVKPFTHISAEQFSKQVEGAMIIDVRTPEEYVEGHIEGAALIDYYDERFKQRIGQLDKDVPYYVYCRTGGRSGEAVSIMKKAGFTQVYGLDGGIVSWQKAGLPVE